MKEISSFCSVFKFFISKEKERREHKIERNNWSGYEVLPYINYSLKQKKKLLKVLNIHNLNIWTPGLSGLVY